MYAARGTVQSMPTGSYGSCGNEGALCALEHPLNKGVLAAETFI